jgi:hypothetical protein
MELSEQQRQAISDHCLLMSWQQLTAWRLQHQGAATDEPELMADWLAGVNQGSQALAEEMVRWLSDRLWRVEPHRGPALGNPAGVYPLDVVCSGLRWTLWLVPKPQLHLQRISRSQIG